LREQFGELVAKRSAVIKKVGELFVDERTYQQRLDLLQHQVNEISAAKLQSGEEEELEQEYIRASNAARLMELCQTAQNHLAEDEAGLIQQAGAIGRAMQELQRLDPAASCLGSLHEQMVLAIRDFQADLGHYFDKLELDPSRLALLEERLNLIKSLKRKYGGSIDDILQFADQAQNELTGLQNREADLAKLRDQRIALEKQLVKLGAELTAARNKARTAFEKGVVTHLKELGFQQSLFAVSIQTEKSPDFESYTPKPSGLDEIEFQFAPNPGEPPKPLRSIASSGELARVMLALKSVLASVDDVPVLVFDEIDANVGGETTRRIASQMRKLGERRQVICITHAAPIAAFGTQHYVVSKHSSLLRTTTSIQVVTKQDRVKELARMLGGESKASVQHAEALLKESAGL
jgi:DNA repair protein RecN (Recombination protein N)